MRVPGVRSACPSQIPWAESQSRAKGVPVALPEVLPRGAARYKGELKKNSAGRWPAEALVLALIGQSTDACLYS
jgi:hypothetical protein